MALNLYSSLCAVVSYWLMAEAAHFRLVNYDAWGCVFVRAVPFVWGLGSAARLAREPRQQHH